MLGFFNPTNGVSIGEVPVLDAGVEFEVPEGVGVVVVVEDGVDDVEDVDDVEVVEVVGLMVV